MSTLTAIAGKGVNIATVYGCLVLMSGPATVVAEEPSTVRIITQPVDQQNVNLGSVVTFSVEATGVGPLNYQWRINNVNLPNANGAFLTVAVQGPSVSGLYSVVVSDANGAVVSGSAKLSVNIPTAEKSDNIAGAPLLTPATSGFIKTDNFSATKELGEPRHAGKKGGRSVWFFWLAPSAGVVTFSTAGSDFNTLLGAYKIQSGLPVSVTNLINVVKADYDDEDDFLTSRVLFNVEAGQTYWIAVDGFGIGEGNIVLQWDLSAVADTLPDVTGRPYNSVFKYGELVQVTAALSDPTRDVSETRWYFNAKDTSVTAPDYGIVKLTEDSVGTYYVRVRTRSDRRFNIRSANFQINIQADNSADTNQFTLDKFQDAFDRATNFVAAPPTVLSLQGWGAPAPEAGGPAAGYTSTQIFSTSTSTKEPGEPDHCGVVGGASEWFIYSPPADGYLQINTDGSSFDTVLAVYTNTPPGGSFSNLYAIACDYHGGANGHTSRVLFRAMRGVPYYIVVDGVNGARGSVRLNINFGDRARIVQPVASQVVPTGSNVTFSVAASGSLPLDVRWRLNGTDIPGATNLTYFLTNATAAGAGVYTAVVSNLINVTVSSGNLDILPPPLITLQPVSQSVAAGGNATLSVATTTASPTYQWQFQRLNIPGATNASFSIAGFQAAQEGPYRVIVSGPGGSSSSAEAMLYINSPSRLLTLGTTGGFHFQLVGLSGTNYVLEASRDLLNWVGLLTNSDPTGLITFTDTNQASGQRFYRTRPLP